MGIFVFYKRLYSFFMADISHLQHSGSWSKIYFMFLQDVIFHSFVYFTESKTKIFDMVSGLFSL